MKRANPVDAAVWLDAPVEDRQLRSGSLEVRGWVRCSAGPELDDLQLCAPSGERLPLDLDARPDVREANPTESTAGFRGSVPRPVAVRTGSWALDCRRGGARIRVDVPWPGLGEDLVFTSAKSRKLGRLRALLACPTCRAALDDDGDHLRCRGCRRTYGRSIMGFDFLSEELVHEGSIHATDNVSSLGYDATAQELVAAASDGLVLDDGAGLREGYLENVVNFEIVPYDSTDVLGIGQRLPFVDDAFDAVLSIAVLEHVRHPFACAAEIVRVLKPGGRLYIAVPFLQPFHGYPDHYYNMTSSGLRNLFDGHLDIEEVGQPDSALPMAALQWFLQSYCNGLPGDAAEEFRAMSVEEIIGRGGSLWDDPIVRSLTAAANEELAAGNYLLASKPA